MVRDSNPGWIVWLSPSDCGQESLLGGKGANLSALAAAELPVPPAYCISTTAYRAFLASQQLVAGASPDRLRDALLMAPVPFELEQVIRAATERLLEIGRRTLGFQSVDQVRLAVRSSATVEDLAAASFAGQGETVLGVQGDTELLAAVRRCWASLWSDQARSYRPVAGDVTAEMALVVQLMVPADVSGIAFSVDPLSGAPVVVIEAVKGLGDRLAAGEVRGTPFQISRDPSVQVSMGDVAGGGADVLLTREQARRVAEMTLAAEEQLGTAQDIEWGFLDDELFLFQSRPITAKATGFFDDHVAHDDYLWTSGFLNERLPRPVSPLGWTLLRELLVPLALADPLGYLGVPLAAIPPLVKLYRGHPYANVTAYQMLYAVFPECLLPADAYRYFPAGDTSMRRKVRYPHSLFHPRTLLAFGYALLRQCKFASPWQNWRCWVRYERRHEELLTGLQQDLEQAAGCCEPQKLWTLHRRAQRLNVELLRIHRWSLTLADLIYTLLHRLLAAWRPGDDSEERAAGLVAGLPSYSLDLNLAMSQMAAGQLEMGAFLARFGHRSFDLDLAHPTFAADPQQVKDLAGRLAEHLDAVPDPVSRARQRQALQAEVRSALAFWQRPVFDHVLGLAQIYMQLRENQRFVWQRTLAFQRGVFVALGECWYRDGLLPQSELVFGATQEEVGAAVLGQAPLPVDQIVARWAELGQLEADHRRAPHLTYPPFLRGNRPLVESAIQEGRSFQGLPVSPGVGSGPARVVLSPSQFDRVQPGDVLVTRGADPGWTPLFAILGGLLLETGGQLSHGAVVAREYGLPAVAALPGITGQLRDGQRVLLDGKSGQVVIEDEK